MDSSCFPSGLSYLAAFGFGVAAIVLSSWLVLYKRAVYREGGGLQSGLAKATPLWWSRLVGVVVLLISVFWLFGWGETCLPAGEWNGLGMVFIGLGVGVASIAVGRLIHNRLRLRETIGLTGNDDETNSHASQGDVVTEEGGPRKLPLERRRVIIEYATTYLVAILVTVIGVGLL